MGLTLRPRTWLLGGLALGLACAPKVNRVDPPEIEGVLAQAHAAPNANVERPANSALERTATSADGPPLAAQQSLERRGPAPTVNSVRDATAAREAGFADHAETWLWAHLEQPQARLELSRTLRFLGRGDEALQLWRKSGPPRIAGISSEQPGEAHEYLRSLFANGAFEEGLRWLGPTQANMAPEILGLLVEGRRRQGFRAADHPDSTAALSTLYDRYDAGSIARPTAMFAVAQAALAQTSTGGFRDANLVLSEAMQTVAGSPAEFARMTLTLARLFLEKYDAEHAAELSERVLAEAPLHPEAHTLLGEVQFTQLDMNAAERSFRSALVLAPEHLEAHAWLAAIDAIEGRRRAARERLDTRVLARVPSHPVGQAVRIAIDIFTGKQAEPDPSAGDLDRQLLVLSELLAAMHLYPEIEQVLAELRREHPGYARMASARGLNRLRLGQEDKGLNDLEKAWALDPFNERTFNTRRLFRETIVPSYIDHTLSPGLEVRLPSERHELMLPELRTVVQATRTALDEAYGIDTGPLRLEFFEQNEDFAIRTTGVPQLGALGVCFGPVITMRGPHHGTHNFHAVLWHEMAHVYAMALSRNRVPRWFTEGLSEWESELRDPAWARDGTEMLRTARDEGRLPELAELELQFLRASSAEAMELAYVTAAVAMRYIGGRFGRDKVIEVLRGYASGATSEQLFVQHFGLTLSQLQQDFRAWLDGELQQDLGWQPTVGDADRIDERTTRFLGAQSMMRAGHAQQALRELRTLVKIGGDGFLVQSAIAQLALSLGDDASAGRALAAAHALDPTDLPTIARMATLLRRRAQPREEAKWLARALDIDAMSFEPAGRALALALVFKDDNLAKRSLDRALAIAPLHPASLAGLAWSIANGHHGASRQRATVLLREAIATTPADATEAQMIAAVAALALNERGLANELIRGLTTNAALEDQVRRELSAMHQQADH